MLKTWLKKLPVDWTLNQRYDRQTRAVIKKVCKNDANTVDVGCHKGEVLDEILKSAPSGQHFGFEPIPHFFEKLKKNYPVNCHFYDLALSNQKGETTFNYVVSNPSYSGIQRRRYDKSGEVDQQIRVKMDLLDSVLPPDLKIDFIKIDVEGAEFLVLQGAEQTLKKWKPVVVFEHGLGGADVYGVRPGQVFDFLQNCGLNISLMGDWLKGKPAFSKNEFVRQFDEGLNYYFIAHAQ